MRRIVASLTPLLSLFVMACAASSPQAGKAGPNQDESLLDQQDRATIARSLLSPGELPHVMWRQKLKITAKGKSYNLEAIVQNDGEQFHVLGLGPGGMKLFLVTHDKNGARSEVYVNRSLALSPEYLLFDIQRALFWAPKSCPAPRSAWSFRDFSLLDQCENGAVLSRVVSDGPSGSANFDSHLHITYAPAFHFKGPPQSIKLRHSGRGYQIEISQLESHSLP